MLCVNLHYQINDNINNNLNTKTMPNKKNQTVPTQTNEVETVSVPSNEATAIVTPTIKTQAELIAEASKYGINTDSLSEMPTAIFDMYVRPKLTAEITAKVADHLGEVFINVESMITKGNVTGAHKLLLSEGIKSVSFDVTDEGLKIKRTLRTANTATGERKQRASKYVITNGTSNYDSLTDMLKKLDNNFTGGINGAGVINKLKKLVNLNDYTVVNQDDNTSEPFAVWASANVANCPNI